MRAPSRLGRALLAVALTAPALLLATTPAQAAPAPLVGVGSGRCLDVTGNASANGAQLQIWDCTGGANQRFRAGTGGGTPQCPVNPVNPNASTQARKLLCYVYSQYGNHIISGQQESTWIGGPDHEINHIRNNTGKCPAIRALDFGDSKDLAPRAIAWWNAGGIPMIGYHMGAPTKPDTYEGTQMQVRRR
ncbi:glycosyl hydrolase [Saccharothrix xinjiangensis]|uniref:Glycosyl hydrolase n=1 Tax=Saccharothrix xinjiangensis TaxID=204798 RepID=A0ABV9Y1V8_9PSEU